MAHPKTYPRCVFCGERANSREHAIPAWIAKRFGLRGVQLHPIHTLATKPRKQPISVASHRARIFCAGCNQHFKHLEDAVIPLVEPMAKGRRWRPVGNKEARSKNVRFGRTATFVFKAKKSGKYRFRAKLKAGPDWRSRRSNVTRKNVPARAFA